jgi:enoyl-[acyl-carrier protein] reductase/trans-2-enoyl-CoA reductase (NAD+)
VEVARSSSGGGQIGNALVIGSSTGYGLGSLLCASFGLGANALGVCFERPSTDDRTGSAGWYNLAEAHRLAKAESRLLRTINADAFSHEAKRAVLDEVRGNFGPLDLVVYSLAAPRRKDADSDAAWSSTLKPIGAPYSGKAIDLRNDSIVDTTIEAATEEEIADTVKVMGGEDWADWMHLLLDAGVLNEGCRTVAYSYVGPEVTRQIYRSGTIGRAKEHLEATADELNAALSERCAGGAWISVNKAVVTQASAAIPAATLYFSILLRLLKERGLDETPVEQMARLFRDHLGPGVMPATDPERRIRLDDREMRPEIQAEVMQVWDIISTENLMDAGGYAAYKREFEQLFGFGVPGIDYTQPTEVHRELV